MNRNTYLYKNEIAEAVAICVTFYLNAMHSDTIDVIYSYKSDVYNVHTLTTEEVFELARVSRNSKNELILATQALNTKRNNQYNKNSTEFATVTEINKFAENFPKYNNGYICEFLYRNRNGESIEQIKHSNNSKNFAFASDTKNNKQIKVLTEKNGATFTTLTNLLNCCKQKNLNTENLENAINFLNKMYNE